MGEGRDEKSLCCGSRARRPRAEPAWPRGCSDLLLRGGWHSLEGWEWLTLEFSSWADGIILPKIQAQGKGGGERKKRQN